MTTATTSKSFSILGKGLKLETKADFEPYLKELREIQDVEEIHLGGNTFGVQACLALAEVVKGLHTLKVADLADIFTGRLITEIPIALTAICNALQDKTSLVELNLSDNAFGGRSADPIVPFLTNNRSFQVLKLNNNGLGITGGTIIASALLESAKLSKAENKASNLRTVICGRNRLENGSAPFWADAFAAHGNLREVEMFQNGIRMEGIEALAKGLSKCPQLEVLNLQDNTATESGTRAVALALPSWPNLRILNVSDCLLGPKGGISLATALSKGRNVRVEVLKLQYAEMDHRAIDILAKAISEHLPSLRALELNGNRADPEDECIKNVRDALEAHGHDDALDELDDMEDPAEDEDEEAAAAASDESEDEKKKEQTEPGVATKVKDAVDDLADLMGKASIGS